MAYSANDESLFLTPPKLAHFGVCHILGFQQPISMANCPEYDRLHAEVETVLANLAQVCTLLLELFRSKDLAGVHRLGKQLELTVGEKERTIGALRQHVKEHNCVGPH